MSIRVVEYKRHGQQGAGWEVDLRIRRTSGERIRERLKVPSEIRTESAARKWAERRAAHLLEHGRPQPVIDREVPTLEGFQDRFLKDYCAAERQKPSSIAAKKSILTHHILPMLGSRRLDEITTADVQALKSALQEKSPKTVNNTISTLGKMLRVAVEWGVLGELPCRLRLLRYRPPEMSFYDFGDYAQLVDAATKLGQEELIAVLLGGDAGLRCGEITALEWSDVNLPRGFITVARSAWHGKVTLPKGGRSRRVPLTSALAAALKAHRAASLLKGPRVLLAERAGPASQKVLRTWMGAAQRRAGLKVNGNLHILRHTFCSHLAMRAAPAMAIKELAGHANLSTTQRYMHLSPAAREDAIRLLDNRPRGGEGEADQHQSASVQ